MVRYANIQRHMTALIPIIQQLPQMPHQRMWTNTYTMYRLDVYRTSMHHKVHSCGKLTNNKHGNIAG